jgi:1,4-dihydroxy-2-naphthoate octaprenyltransferase
MDPLNDNSVTKLNLDEYQQNKQNLPLALIAGIIAMFISAIAWAVVTVITNYQIGWMAIGVGFLVGLAVRLGNGTNNLYRYLGAGLALLGCILGNFFTFVGVFGNTLSISPIEALKLINYADVPSVMVDMASPIDFLFYAFAIFQAYKISVRSSGVE